MRVFVTGGTGYLGGRLIPLLLDRGHRVRALARPESAHRLPAGAGLALGDALDADSYADAVSPFDTLVHLVGTPRPNPSKARQFREVDLASAREAVRAAGEAGVRHLVYVSVAHPAPVMQAYVEARMEAEEAIRASGIPATVLRPWYVLGPGHRWPYLLLPAYAVAGRLASTRETARRLGLVTLRQMVRALAAAVEDPPAEGMRVLDVPTIRASILAAPPRRHSAASPVLA
ncbi:MAG TPA: NAD(P)H-binding protein [Longimicrobium sp.]|nr:NAD(P)H-binding protein [Longimicrobium sp.]